MKPHIFSAILTGLASYSVHAQQPSSQLPETVVEAKRLKGIVPEKSRTATKTDTPLIEIPQSVSTVTREEMDQRGVETTAEALRYIPGVITGIGGEDSRVDDITIRGFEIGSATANNSTNNVFLDGLRVPSGGQWTRVQQDIFGLERVDVLKGPASVLYGQAAPGGLLNLTSKHPLVERRNFLGFRYGSFDTWQAAGDFTGPIDAEGKFSYRLLGLYREGGAQVDHTDLSRVFIAPSFTWQPTNNTKLTVLTSYQDDHGGSTFQFLPVEGTLRKAPRGRIDRDTFIGEPDFNTYDREQWTAGYELTHQFNDALTLSQNLRYASVDTFYESIVAGRTPPNAAGLMSRRAVRGDGDAWNVAVDTRLHTNFSTGPVKHQTIIGIDQIWSDWTHVRTGTNSVPSINIFDPVYTGISGAFALQVGQDVDEHQTGVYVQDQMELDRWHFSTALRYDWSRSDLRNTLTGTRTITDAEDLTGNIGLLYVLDHGISPYASFATSFEPVSGADYDGHAFDPSKGKQYEIGVKYEPEHFDALFTLSAFQLTQKNVLTPDPDALHTGFSVQTGEIEIRGVELESKISLTEGLVVIGSITWLDSEVTKSNTAGEKGKPKGAIPDHMASLWLDYTVQQGPIEGLGAGLGVRYIGSRYGANGEQFHIPSVTLLDAAVRYDLGKLNPTLKGTNVALTASNLTDKTYVAKAETLTSANWGPGRVVSLRVNHTW